MIEIKAFTKSKSQGGSSGGSSSKTTYVNTVVSEADHAARADKAKRADAADAADYATRAGTAVTANHATTADEISGDAETLLDYLFAGETDRIQKVLGSVEFSRLLTLAGGLKSSNIYNQGNLRNDGDIYSVGGITADGDITCGDTVKTKNLEVTGSAHFFELVIDKVKAMGGAVLITPADGFDVDLAEETADGYILCWRCDDGNGKQRDNMWKVGDQALCMSFNQAKVGGDGAHDVHNKYYWALVTGVSDKAIPIEIDGVKYHYIAISSTDCDGTVSPEVGDSIVMLGYRGTDDAARQSAIYISAYSSLDSGLTAPLLAQYRGINDFNLASHRKSYFDAKGSRLVGDFETSSGQTMEEYVDGQVSGVSNELNGLRNDLDEKADKSELDDKASKDDMKTMESSILQTARQISLEVSEKYVGRRNLLVGSALRKQGEGVEIALYGNMSNGEGIVINEGVNDVNCVKVTSKSSTQYCGLFWRASQAQNVKIKRNTKYVASVWVKCSNTNCNVQIEGIYHAGTSEAERHGQVNKVTSYPTLKAGEWQLFAAVFSTGGDYDYMECNFWVKSNSETTVYFCKPMLEEGDTYNGWTLSEQDYDYVGGNLLDNARTLTVGGNLAIADGEIAQQGYGGESVTLYKTMSALKGTVSSYDSLPSSATIGDRYAVTDTWYIYEYTSSGWVRDSGESLQNDIVKGDFSFENGKDYIVSWYAKGTGDIGAYVAGVSQKVFSEHSDGEVIPTSTYGERRQALFGEWKRFWMHVRPISGTTNKFVIRQYRNNDNSSSYCYVTQPKLEEGATMTEWTERKTDLIDKASLKAAGINITSSAVELYGDQVKVSSTKGGTPTAMFTDGKVNADLIEAKVLKTYSNDGSSVVIEKGIMSVFGTMGVCNIKFGVNDDGMAVLSYYDNNGLKLYDLGPGGIDAGLLESAKISEAQYVSAKWFFGTEQFYEPATYAGRKFLQVLSKYESKLFGNRVYALDDDEIEKNTHQGFKPFASSSANILYQYTAGRINGQIVADSSRGLTTPSLAKDADGKFFTSSLALASDGKLTNLANGVYFRKDTTVQYAPYPMNSSEEYKFPAYCVNVQNFSNGKSVSVSSVTDVYFDRMIYGNILRTISNTSL